MQNKILIPLLILISCLFAPITTVAQETTNSENNDVVGDIVDDQASDIVGEEGGEFLGGIVNDFVEQQGGGFLGNIFGGSGGIDDEFLENQTGFVPEALALVNRFFNINIERGRFSLRSLGEIFASIEDDEDCPAVLHIVPGICPDGVEGLDLPEAAEIEDDGDVRGSGELRRNSEPQQDLLTSNRLVIERDLANLFDQESARAFAFDYLDETGDEWLLGNTLENQALLEGSNLIVEDLIQLAADAQELDVTQDVAKVLAGMSQLNSQIDANNGIMLGRINTSLLNIQQQNASLMQLSANNSEAFDEINRARRTEQDITSLESFRTTLFLPGLPEGQ